MGKITIIMCLITESGTRRAIWAPSTEPVMAKTAEIPAMTIFPFKYPCFSRRAVDTSVPMVELILLVPSAIWAGTPAIR